MKSCAVPVLVILVTVGFTQADWATNPKWGFQVRKGSDIELICNDTVAQVASGDMLSWVNPHGEKIMINSDKYMLSSHNGVDQMKLKVMDVQDVDHGVYLCYIMRNNAHYFKVNRAINYKDAEYEHIIDKYRYNIMVGGIAAAALFVPLVVMCLIYKYRYMTEEEKEFEKNAEMMRKRTHAHDLEAGPLPDKHAARNGAQGQYNRAYAESTNL